jgi:hypothetical protein
MAIRQPDRVGHDSLKPKLGVAAEGMTVGRIEILSDVYASAMIL